jgi:hypothetical protein
MGLMAGYLATKLNWFGTGGIFSGNATLSSIFGLSSTVADAITSAASSAAIDPATQVAISNAVTSSQNAVAQAQAAQQAAAAASDQAAQVAANLNSITLPTVQAGSFTIGQEYEITEVGTTDFTTVGATSNTVGTRFTATGSGTGTGYARPIGFPPKKKSVNFPSNIMPNLFGEGLAPNTTTRAGIWTHDYLVFGDSVTAPELLDKNKAKAGSMLEVSLTGEIKNFFNIPNAGTFSQKPFYDETGTDKYVVDTKLTLYYSTATYTSGNLDQQSWSNWTKISSNDGVGGSVHPVVVMSNPPDPVPPIELYVSESGKPTNTAGAVNQNLNSANLNRDPFEENLPIITSTIVDDRSKATSITTSGVQLFDGGTKLIIFGASAFNIPDGTPFANNTLFAHKTAKNYVVWAENISLRQVSTGSGLYVGIDANSPAIYWSDDGIVWIKLVAPSTLVNSDPDWPRPTPKFRFTGHDGTKFYAFGFGDQITTSTDGKNWSKWHTTSGLDVGTVHVIISSGHYLALGSAGIQNSNDGITWTVPSIPSGMVHAPTCGVWDGSQYIIGGTWNASGGNLLWTSTNGTTWTSIDSFLNSPSNSTFISNSNTNALNAELLAETNAVIAAQNYRNASLDSPLPA